MILVDVEILERFTLPLFILYSCNRRIMNMYVCNKYYQANGDDAVAWASEYIYVRVLH